MASSASRTRHFNPFIAVVLVIVVIGIAAVALTTTDNSNKKAKQTAHATQAVVIKGKALPPAPTTSDAVDPAIGKIAPTVIGKNFDGTTVSITPDGTPKVVQFVAHWCPHCQRDVAATQQWLASNQLPDGVDQVTVSTLVYPDRDNFPPQAWLTKANWPIPVLADSPKAQVARAYGLTSTPLYVVLDGNNKVLLRRSGELGGDALASLAQSALKNTQAT